MGSSKHELFEEDLMIFVTYAASTGVKESIYPLYYFHQIGAYQRTRENPF